MIEPNYNQRLRKIRILPIRNTRVCLCAPSDTDTPKKTINVLGETQKRTTGEHRNEHSTSPSWQLTSRRRVVAFFSPENANEKRQRRQHCLNLREKENHFSRSTKKKEGKKYVKLT